MRGSLSGLVPATVAATVAATVVALTLTGPASARPAPTGDSQLRSVTPGSYLVLVDQGSTAASAFTEPTRQFLELVTPTGQASTVYSSKVSDSTRMSLLDWSVDGSTALLGVPHRHGLLLRRVSVSTGTTTDLKVKNLDNAVLDPDGSGVVAMLVDPANDQGSDVLARVAWDGTVTRLPVSTSRDLMAGPGETVLTGPPVAKSGAYQLVAISTGATVHTYSLGKGCLPVRDWDAGHVLLRCNTGLALLDWSTGATTSLVSVARDTEEDPFDARTLPSGRYLSEVDAGCDVFSLARLAANGTVHELHVHSSVKYGNLLLVGTSGKDLVVQHETNPCAGPNVTSELTLVNPVTGKEKPLLVLGRRQALELDVFVFGEVRASQM
jgi:hypothetical protein